MTFMRTIQVNPAEEPFAMLSGKKSDYFGPSTQEANHSFDSMHDRFFFLESKGVKKYQKVA